MWVSLGLIGLLVLTTSRANPVTTETTSTGSTSTAGLTTHSTTSGTLLEAAAEVTETAGTNTPGPTNQTTTESALLQEHLATMQSLRGRVILANTRVEGSDEWGVNAAEAEKACIRIAKYQSEGGDLGSSLLSDFLQRFFSDSSIGGQRPRSKRSMQGHLLSVGSSYEVMALSRLLSPLPDGAYWTGGKLTRYRVNKMHKPLVSDHVILTWSDGRIGKASILGLTQEDEKQLKEGFTYCLALDLKEATWQARDCSDRLPYACLITPRQTRFKNKVSHSSVSSVESVKVTETTGQDTKTATTRFAETTADLLSAEMSTGQPVTMATRATITTSAPTTAKVLDAAMPETTRMPTTSKVLDAAMYKTSRMPTTGHVLSGAMHEVTGTPATAKFLAAAMPKTTRTPTTSKVLDAAMYKTTRMPTTGHVLGGAMHEVTGTPATAKVFGAAIHETTGTPTTSKILDTAIYKTSPYSTTRAPHMTSGLLARSEHHGDENYEYSD